jgi:hypothetical protein
MLKSGQPRGLAFAGGRTVQNADGMATLLEFGGGGEDIRFRAAEGTKTFVDKQYSHNSISLPASENNVKIE